MVSTPAEIVTEVSPLQFENVFVPMVFATAAIVTKVSRLQLETAELRTADGLGDSTPAGIVTEVSHEVSLLHS